MPWHSSSEIEEIHSGTQRQKQQKRNAARMILYPQFAQCKVYVGDSQHTKRVRCKKRGPSFKRNAELSSFLPLLRQKSLLVSAPSLPAGRRNGYPSAHCKKDRKTGIQSASLTSFDVWEEHNCRCTVSWAGKEGQHVV